MLDHGAWSTACQRATPQTKKDPIAAQAAYVPICPAGSAQPDEPVSTAGTPGPSPASVASRRTTTRKPRRCVQYAAVAMAVLATANQNAAWESDSIILAPGDAAERLCQLELLVLAGLAHTVSETLFQLPHRRADLALVLLERLDLRLEMVGHIHIVVRVRAAGQEHFFDAVDLQPLHQVLRVREVVPGQRIDGIDRRLPRKAVVAVREAAAERVPGDHRVRLQAPDLADDAAAGLGCVLVETVRVAQEDHILHTQGLRRCPLLFLAHAAEVLPRDLFVVRPHVAAGGQEVVHIPTLSTELRDCTGAEELGVVRVGNDDQGSLLLFGLRHASDIPHQSAEARTES